MRVRQVDRSTNSVTINVSGITVGDRQTYIWMPATILNSDSGYWFTLSEASSNGYITKIETDYETNNGDITVYLPQKYCQEYKVVDLAVINVNTGFGNVEARISAVLQFKFKKNPDSDKAPGDDVDITVEDMRAINKFGCYIAYWMCLDANGNPTNQGIHYPLTGVESGDLIYADYLWQPAQNILYASDFNRDKFTGINFDKVNSNAYTIVNGCVSGADFKAYYFNGIKAAINNFNMSVTV